MAKHAPALFALLWLAGGCATTPPPRVQASAYEQALATAAAQVRRCYRAPRVGFSGRQIVTRLRVRYAPDGQLAALPRLVWQTGVTTDNRVFAPRMAEAAIAAVLRCVPMALPAELYRDGASEFDLTFSPLAAA